MLYSCALGARLETLERWVRRAGGVMVVGACYYGCGAGWRVGWGSIGFGVMIRGGGSVLGGWFVEWMGLVAGDL